MPQQYPVSAIAALLKLSERRIYQLVKDGIIPRPVKGQYEPIGCVHGYTDYLKRLATGGGELTLTDERTKLTRYQAALAELQYRKESGELIRAKRATQIWGEGVTAVRQRLLGLSTRLAPSVATSESIPEIKELIDTAVHEVLNELGNPNLEDFARIESSLESAEGLPPTSEIHSQPVGGRKKKTKSRIKRRARPVANKPSGVPKSGDGRVQRAGRGDGDTNDLEPG